MTAHSRTLEIRADGRGLWEIYWAGGGTVPLPLSGKFTDKLHAENAIKTFQTAIFIKTTSKRRNSNAKQLRRQADPEVGEAGAPDDQAEAAQASGRGPSSESGGGAERPEEQARQGNQEADG